MSDGRAIRGRAEDTDLHDDWLGSAGGVVGKDNGGGD